jgi:hypothetical protein
MAIYPLAHKVHSYISYGLVIYNAIYLCDIFEVSSSVCCYALPLDIYTITLLYHTLFNYF